MSFISRIRNKPIVLDFYTSRADTFNFAQPMKAVKAYPEWWKKLPHSNNVDSIRPTPTMKRCVGFTNLYESGFVLPMWSDINIQTEPIGTDGCAWQYSDGLSFAAVHSEDQRGAYLPPTHYQHIKLTCPWVAVCKEDVNWMFVGATWNFGRPESVVIPPAVVDFTHQVALNVNMFLVKEPQATIHNIPLGQPLLHVVPMTERPVEYRYHLISEMEQKKYEFRPLAFLNSYRKTKNLTNGKCPFN